LRRNGGREQAREGDIRPSRTDGHRPTPLQGTRHRKEDENEMKTLRRLLISVGAIAAFMMAAGAGWKN
jgi:hypothetical protein